MSDNPYQNDRGNKDLSIAKPGASTMSATPGTGAAMNTASAFLIGDTMTGAMAMAPTSCMIAPSR